MKQVRVCNRAQSVQHRRGVQAPALIRSEGCRWFAVLFVKILPAGFVCTPTPVCWLRRPRALFPYFPGAQYPSHDLVGMTDTTILFSIRGRSQEEEKRPQSVHGYFDASGYPAQHSTSKLGMMNPEMLHAPNDRRRLLHGRMRRRKRHGEMPTLLGASVHAGFM